MSSELARIKALERRLDSNPPQQSRLEVAHERLTNGTLTDKDLDPLGWDAAVLDRTRQRLVGWAMPFKRVRAAGIQVRNYGWARDVLGHLLSFAPEERPPESLIEKVRHGLQAYPRTIPVSVDDHNHYVISRRAMGADDGRPLREAIGRGDYGPDVGAEVPPAGVGDIFCPLSCIASSNPLQCLCSGTCDVLSYKRPPEGLFLEALRSERARRAKPPDGEAANRGQTRPADAPALARRTGSSANGTASHDPKPTIAEVVVPYAEPGTGTGPPPRVNRNRNQTINPPSRRPRRWQ